MEFNGIIKFINTPEDIIECEWMCYNINLSFVPPIGSSIVLSESSITSGEEIYIADISLLDEETLVVFEDLDYSTIHTTISEILKEFEDGLNKWLKHHKSKTHIVRIEKPKKEVCKRMETLLLQKFDVERANAEPLTQDIKTDRPRKIELLEDLDILKENGDN